jgi:hypothetical protein
VLQQSRIVLLEQLPVARQRAAGFLDVGRRLLQRKRQPAESFGEGITAYGGGVSGTVFEAGFRTRVLKHPNPHSTVTATFRFAMDRFRTGGIGQKYGFIS